MDATLTRRSGIVISPALIMELGSMCVYPGRKARPARPGPRVVVVIWSERVSCFRCDLDGGANANVNTSLQFLGLSSATVSKLACAGE